MVAFRDRCARRSYANPAQPAERVVTFYNQRGIVTN
jgi:hypothetical protein